jgi:DnaJ-domain-containing protein 1
MSGDDLLLFCIVVVAFIVGYWVVSFIAKRLKSHFKPDESADADSQSASASSNRKASTSGQSPPSGDAEDRNRAERQRETSDPTATERAHAKALGLDGKVTAYDIKRAYRQQLSKYHPDKVNHLGEEFQKIADLRTRQVITAYEYFREKYNIT